MQRQQRGMRLGVVTFGLVAAVAGTACRPEPRGNGKHGALQFQLPSAPTAAGLEQPVLLLKAGLDDVWDFEGTRVELSGPEGVVVEREVPRPYATGDFILPLRCPAGFTGTAEVGVRVMDGGSVRYADAFDLTCAQPTELLLTLREGAPTGRHAIGSIGPTLHAQLRADGVDLEGKGLRLTEDGGGVELQYHDDTQTWPPGGVGLNLLPRAPAGFVRLRAGALTAEVPMSVVADAEWTLEVATLTPYTDGTRAFRARSRHLDGSLVVQPDACELTVDLGSGPTAPQTVGCGVDFPAGTRVRVCMRVREKEACAGDF